MIFAAMTLNVMLRTAVAEREIGMRKFMSLADVGQAVFGSPNVPAHGYETSRSIRGNRGLRNNLDSMHTTRVFASILNLTRRGMISFFLSVSYVMV